MPDYEAVIGLEVHAQLATASKIFCSCPTTFGDEPNMNVCPVCAGMPGVLPVMNGLALEYACKMALAVDCTVNPTSIFARKNYFYPDLPKAYQISQYEQPLAEHGSLRITLEDGSERIIGITRIHMEEDAGKLVHASHENASYVDLNRCGVPLIEIVSEPDMRSAEEAVAYLKELHAILVYLGICDGNMEEGSFRCDANVSIRPRGQEAFGVRAELKNLNSFRNVQRAIEIEISRHEAMLEDGETIVQETRLYNAEKNQTFSMRSKEEAHDYRYFPDPDLLPLRVEESMLDAWRAELPELPSARRERFQTAYGLPAYDAGVLTAQRPVADYFEAAAACYPEPKKLSNWIMGEILRELSERDLCPSVCKLTPARLADLLGLVDKGDISATVGKKLVGELMDTGEEVAACIERKGLTQISDSDALATLVDELWAKHPAEAERLKAGEKKLTGFFVGQIMRATKGQANPQLVNELLAKKAAE